GASGDRRGVGALAARSHLVRAGCRGGRGQLGGADWQHPVHRACVRVRSDVDPDPRGDGGGGGHRAEGTLMVPLNYYLVLSAILFAIGTAGVFLRRNLITVLLSIEIMLNAVNLTFVAVGRFLGTVDGQIIVFFVMTVAAAEAAVGLALVIPLFRHKESPGPGVLTSLKWYLMLSYIPLLPFVGFLINALVGKRLSKAVSRAVACVVMLAAFAVSAFAAWTLVQQPIEPRLIEETVFDWIVAGDF